METRAGAVLLLARVAAIVAPLMLVLQIVRENVSRLLIADASLKGFKKLKECSPSLVVRD